MRRQDATASTRGTGASSAARAAGTGVQPSSPCSANMPINLTDARPSNAASDGHEDNTANVVHCRCGPCLAARMGEDIRDALANPVWRCPCCRGICNCSGATCLRKSHGLGTTGQLVLEAKSLGYPSV